MMKNILSILFSFFALSVSAQLVNDGGTIVVENGATLFIESNLQNNTVGANVGDIQIIGTGIVNVQGDFTNDGTFTMEPTSKLIFSGSTNADATSGGATLSNVEISKTGADVTLLDDMTITESLDFTTNDNKINLGDFNLTLDGDATADVSGTTGSWVVTNGTGLMQKEDLAGAAFMFPIGDATNYSPINVDVTAGTNDAGSVVGVATTNMEHPDKPLEATDFINRYWDVTAANITGYNATLTGTYVGGDVTGTAGDVNGATYDGSDWSFDGASNGANQVIADVTAMDADLTGMNKMGRPDLKIFLQGPYSGGSMTTTLSTNNVIPLESPYTDAPITLSSVPADVVDWIKVEVRDETTPGTVISKNSAFLKSDGSIVSVDGTSLPFLLNAPDNAVIAIYHRNHLPVNSSSSILMDGGVYDFSTGLAQAYDNPGITSNDAMTDLGGGVFGLFRANVNGDGFVNGLDFGLTRINSNPPAVNVYSPYDVNLDSNRNGLDFGLARISSNPPKTAHIQ